MLNRPLLRRPPLLVPAFLALAFAVLTPAIAAAQDAFVSLYEGREVLIFDPTNPSAVTQRISTGTGRPTGLVVTDTAVYVLVDATVRLITRNASTGEWELQPDIAYLNATPEQLALTPDGETLWVPNMHQQMWTVDVDTFAANLFVVPGRPKTFGIAMVSTPAGLQRAYVSLPELNVVHVYDVTLPPAANSLLTTIPLGDDASGAPVTNPRGIAASPHGDRVYVASMSGHISVIDTNESNGGGNPIPPAHRVLATVVVGDSPQNVTVSASGTEVYATLPGVGALATIDTDSYSFTSLAINSEPNPSDDIVHGLSLNDAGYVVVAHSGADVLTAYDTTSGMLQTSDEIVPPSPIETSTPRYVAFEPVTPVAPPLPPDDPPYFDPATFCDFTYAGEVGTPLTFNIIARDDNSLTLDVLEALPPGASMNPDLPFTTNGTANSTFVWTPAEGDAGTHDLTYTADDGVNAAVNCAVSIDVPEPPPPVGDGVTFDAFDLRLASINTRGRFADSFWFNGNFTVDLENGDGVNPPEETVTIAIEGVEFAIPAGKFRNYWRGRLFKYRGTIDGAKFLVYITPRRRNGGGRYNINVSGWRANLDGAENPLQMCVSIGDDFGCAEKKGRIR